MPAAIPIAIAAGTAGATIYGANRASNAAQGAARTQSDAANRAADLQYRSTQDALNFQREQWNQARQDFAPYLQMGRQSLGTLGNMMGFQGGSSPMAQGPQGPPMAQGGAGMPPGGAMPSGGGGTLGSMGQGGYSAPEMVWMQAPTGDKRQVPRAMVEHYRSRGAQVIDG